MQSTRGRRSCAQRDAAKAKQHYSHDQRLESDDTAAGLLAPRRRSTPSGGCCKRMLRIVSRRGSTLWSPCSVPVASCGPRAALLRCSSPSICAWPSSSSPRAPRALTTVRLRLASRRRHATAAQWPAIRLAQQHNQQHHRRHNSAQINGRRRICPGRAAALRHSRLRLCRARLLPQW